MLNKEALHAEPQWILLLVDFLVHIMELFVQVKTSEISEKEESKLSFAASTTTQLLVAPPCAGVGVTVLVSAAFFLDMQLGHFLLLLEA